jgi:uncharacterized protein YukE
MARMGMDVDAVEAVSKQLKTQAQQIGTLVASIDKIVNGLTGVWDGPDAHTFVTNWWPQHKKELLTAQTRLGPVGAKQRAGTAERLQPLIALSAEGRVVSWRRWEWTSKPSRASAGN